MPATEIKTYWQAAPREQGKIRRQVERAEERAALEAYAAENRLIIYKGKAIKPEDYPCKCELENPSDCQEQKQMDAGREYKNGQCRCRCHQYYEPF